MKRLMLLLAFGLAATEKLDRTYLPPPGSKYAGDEPGDLQVPLEFPKQAYTTTAPLLPGQKNNEPASFGDTRLVPGSFQTPGLDFSGQPQDIIPVTTSSKPPFNYFQSKVPTTTTSYAFTQTTTFPPTEGFETTLSPIFPVEGSLGEQPAFVNQPFSQEQIFNQPTGQNRPNFVQPTNQLSQRPGFSPNSNVSGVQTSFPGGQSFEGRPVYAHDQNNSQIQQSVPVSTASPIFGSSFQPGFSTFPPYTQGYTQHLGIQPPRQYNQQGYFPSSTAAPGFQTGFPVQNNGEVSNILTPKITSQQPIGYPTNGPQQSTQYIDKYDNVQNHVVPGVTDPQQIQQGQSPFPQPGQMQYGGNLNPISGTSSSTFPFQQGVPNFPPIGPQKSVTYGTPNTGTNYGQQQGFIARPQYPDQKGPFLTSTPTQGTNLPITNGVKQEGQQFVDQQRPYLPSTTSEGVVNNQGYQYPQFDKQQTNIPSTDIAQPRPISGTLVNYSQRPQQPEIGAQQNIYPSFGNSQNEISQQQLGSQQGLYPSNQISGKIGANQQGGLPQFIGQQGSITPGQFTYQQPGAINQQTSLSSVGTSPGSFLPGPTNSQQTQITQQSTPMTGFANNLQTKPQSDFYKQGGNVNNISTGIIADNRIPSQQSVSLKPGARVVTDSPLNIDRPGTSAVPSGYQQPFFTSTTPSSIPSYSTTPGRVYPSVTPSFSQNDLGSRRPAIISPRPERPQAESDRNAVILNYDNVLTPEGFAYSFDTSNGIHADENGTAIGGVKADGSYSYVGDDGKLYSVVYTADENGFQPHGDHLPTPPPVPKAIQQIIEQATKDKEAGVSHDGFYDEEKYGYKKYQSPKYRRPETQDKVIEGAGNEYESTYDGKDLKKKIGPNEERKIISTFSTYAPEDNDGSRYNTDEIIEMNIDGSVQEQSFRKNLSGRPVYKKPGPYEYEVEKQQDLISGKQPQLKGQGSQRRPFNPEKEASRRRPGTSSHKEKPVYFKDQSDNSQEYDDKKFSVKEEEYSNESKDDRKLPSKTTGIKYSGNSQKNNDDGRFPGRFDNEGPSLAGVIKGERPNKYGTQSVKNTYDLKQITGKGTRPQRPGKGPSKAYGTKYQVNDDGTNDQEDYQEHNFYEQENQYIVGGSKDSKKMGPTPTRNEFVYNQKPGINYQENTFDNMNYPSGSRFEQKGQTLYDQQYGQDVNKKIPVQSGNEETGYQYTPPQLKFEQGKQDRFPSRFSEKAITKTPVSKYGLGGEKTTVQPFITPNVHRDEEGSYEDASDENSRLKESGKMMSKVPDYQTTKDSSEYFDEESEPEKQFYGENDSSTKKRPVKPGKTTSVYRPGYQSQQNTGKPEYYDEYTTEKEEKTSQPGLKRPENDRFPSDYEKQSTQGRPEQDYSEETVETSKTPSFTYFSSTTPMPTRKPYCPDYKQTSPQGQSHYSTTYEPLDNSSAEEDYNEGVTGPGYSISKSSSRRPIISSTTPSTTKDRPSASRTKIVSSRPTYDYSYDRTMVSESPAIRPGISESKPSVRPGGSKKPSYSTTSPQTSRPDLITSNMPDYPEDYDRKKPEVGQFYSVQKGNNYPEKTITGSESPELYISQNIGQSGSKYIPSTTYRPNYSITTVFQPGPVSVDKFGRPIQSVLGSGTTTQPGVSVTSGQGTSSNVYEDTGAITPAQPTFKPTEARFGGPVQGVFGQKPAEFGPSSFTTPGYLGPQDPLTGKVIGEDFSGPKQQQKYDPKTGYYY